MRSKAPLFVLLLILALSIFATRQSSQAQTIPPSWKLYMPVVKTMGIPTATPQPVPTSTPTVSPTATTVSGPCQCHGDLYNCSDFETQDTAQQCFNWCSSQGAGDIHKLDFNNDGIACESNP
jgi:hypothetical protein